MEIERTYHIFPCIGNSPRVNQLNFLAWQIEVGRKVSLGPVRREEGSHLGAARPQSVIEFAVPEDIEIEWLGDTILGHTASGSPLLRASAIDETLFLDLSAELGAQVKHALRTARQTQPPVAVSPVGERTEKQPLASLVDGEWRLSWEDTAGTGTLRVRVDPADYQAPMPDADGSTAHPDLDLALAKSRQWIDNTPSLAGYPEFEEAWNHTWMLHRVSTFPPVAKFPYRWETPGRGYLFHYFGHWDAVHNVLDMLWHDLDHCICIVRNLLRLQDPDDGRFGVTFNPRRNDFRHALAKQTDAATTPPLWNYAAIEVFRRTGDMDFLAECYSAFRRNVIWFEVNRQFALNGLFWHNNLGETGYDNMPRGEFRDAAQMPPFSDFAAVDLSSQMVKYYRDLADMASLLKEYNEAEDYRRKADILAAAIRTTLWDDDTGFFFDSDVRTGELTRVKTIAGFWPMVSGVADEAQVARLVAHLTNPAEFWTPYPVPSVSCDEASFCLDCWRGPVWASQNLWMILGLQDYGYHDVAAAIAQRTMRMVASGLRSGGYVYEFYNPNDFDTEALSRKSNALGPCKYYIGHNPIHAIFFAGIYGMRSREAGMEICPQWKHMPDESSVQFAFSRGRSALSASSTGEGSWQLFSDGEEIFRGTEGTPAILDYDSLKLLTRKLEAVRMGTDDLWRVESEVHSRLPAGPS